MVYSRDSNLLLSSTSNTFAGLTSTNAQARLRSPTLTPIKNPNPKLPNLLNTNPNNPTILILPQNNQIRIGPILKTPLNTLQPQQPRRSSRNSRNRLRQRRPRPMPKVINTLNQRRRTPRNLPRADKRKPRPRLLDPLAVRPIVDAVGQAA